MSEEEESHIVAAGGWCAPSDNMYEINQPIDNIMDLFPMPTILRRGTPEWETQRKKIEALVRADREYAQMVDRQHERMAQETVISGAALVAMIHRWDVHVYRRSYVPLGKRHAERFIGIEFQPSKYGIPMLHEHDDDYDD